MWLVGKRGALYLKSGRVHPEVDRSCQLFTVTEGWRWEGSERYAGTGTSDKEEYTLYAERMERGFDRLKADGTGIRSADRTEEAGSL